MVICDRCNKKLDKTRWPVAYGRGNNADLCEECYKGFLEYIGKKENENESEESH